MQAAERRFRLNVERFRLLGRKISQSLRKMKPIRQIDAVELMMAMNNFTSRYAQALLAATRQEDLAQPERPKKIRLATVFPSMIHA